MGFRNKQILITGGLGFIGSNLAMKLVKQGAKIQIIDAIINPYGANLFNIQEIKNKVEFIKADIRNKEAIKKYVNGKDYIFHLAGQVSRIISMEDPFLDNEINCLGTLNILEAIKKYNPKAKIIFAGSRGEIGNPRSLPVCEDTLPLPDDIYGANKLSADHYLRIYHQAYGIKTVTLRINNVYGPRCQMKSNHYGVVNLFMDYVYKNKTIPVYGDGSQTRDYIYIDDLVEAFLLVAESSKTDGNCYLIGSGMETKFIDMVRIVIEVMGRGKFKLCKFPKLLNRIDARRFCCDIRRIKADTGWKPKTSLKEGIQKTVEFYNKNLKYYH